MERWLEVRKDLVYALWYDETLSKISYKQICPKKLETVEVGNGLQWFRSSGQENLIYGALLFASELCVNAILDLSEGVLSNYPSPSVFPCVSRTLHEVGGQ